MLEFRSILHRGTALVVAGVGWLCLAQPLTAALALDAPIQLSQFSSENENASIATSSDGTRTVVAWDGIVDGQRRIVLREQIDGLWHPNEILIDNEPTADNQHPSVALDPAGDYHVAWLGRVGGKLRVFYAFRKGGRAVVWGHIDGGEGADDSCKGVSIRLDDQDRPWIVWQSGAGSHVSIRCARMDAAIGGFTADELTPQAGSYNLYPELFFMPSAVVLWYADFESDVILTGRQFDAATGTWYLYVPENLDSLDADRFPYLFERSSGLLAGLWPGQITEADRVLVGLQSPDTHGTGGAINHRLDGLNDFISGTASGDEMIAVWRSWTIDGGAHIYFSHGSELPFAVEIPLSDDLPGYNSRPRAAGVSGGAAVVWHSTALDGGDGHIYFRRVAF